MKILSRTEVLSISAKKCDCCGEISNVDDAEFNEFLSIDRVCGYASVFGDGEHIAVDLCQRCVKNILGEWIRR